MDEAAGLSRSFWRWSPRANLASLPAPAQVAVIWILDTIHQGLILHSVYAYLVTNYGNPIALTFIERSLLVSTLPRKSTLDFVY